MKTVTNSSSNSRSLSVIAAIFALTVGTLLPNISNASIACSSEQATIKSARNSEIAVEQLYTLGKGSRKTSKRKMQQLKAKLKRAVSRVEDADAALEACLTQATSSAIEKRMVFTSSEDNGDGFYYHGASGAIFIYRKDSDPEARFKSFLKELRLAETNGDKIATLNREGFKEFKAKTMNLDGSLTPTTVIAIRFTGIEFMPATEYIPCRFFTNKEAVKDIKTENGITFMGLTFGTGDSAGTYKITSSSDSEFETLQDIAARLSLCQARNGTINITMNKDQVGLVLNPYFWLDPQFSASNVKGDWSR